MIPVILYDNHAQKVSLSGMELKENIYGLKSHLLLMSIRIKVSVDDELIGGGGGRGGSQKL